MSNTPKTPAQINYEAYAEKVGGATFDGNPLPKFEDLGDRQKDGWAASADNAGFPVVIDQAVSLKLGLTGRVSSLHIGRDNRRGFWIDSIDANGRPFEHYALVADLAYRT